MECNTNAKVICPNVLILPSSHVLESESHLLFVVKILMNSHSPSFRVFLRIGEVRCVKGGLGLDLEGKA